MNCDPSWNGWRRRTSSCQYSCDDFNKTFFYLEEVTCLHQSCSEGLPRRALAAAVLRSRWTYPQSTTLQVPMSLAPLNRFAQPRWSTPAREVDPSIWDDAAWSPILGVQLAWKPDSHITTWRGSSTLPGWTPQQYPTMSHTFPTCTHSAWPLAPEKKSLWGNSQCNIGKSKLPEHLDHCFSGISCRWYPQTNLLPIASIQCKIWYGDLPVCHWGCGMRLACARCPGPGSVLSPTTGLISQHQSPMDHSKLLAWCPSGSVKNNFSCASYQYDWITFITSYITMSSKQLLAAP